MCGRYASTRSAADLAELFGVEDLTDGDLVPDYNLAPTDPAPVVLASGAAASAGGAALQVARWGFVPAWAKGAAGPPMINARGETVATSRMFGEALRRRRCLVPADGWYEWRLTGGPRSARQPYFMTCPEGVVFAGIWSGVGAAPAGPRRPLITFSIITVPARGDLAAVHDRMPLLLEPARWDAWLDAEMLSAHGSTTSSEVTQLLTPPSSKYCAGIEIRPVSARVGDVRNDGPELVRRIAVAPLSESTMDNQPMLF
jgi:putative SOS response-associated peptidase YedK